MGIWMLTDHSLFLRTSKEHFCVARINAFEIFWQGVPPVEPGLGFDSCFSRRIGRSSVLDIVELSVQVSVKTARGQIARISDQGVFCACFGSCANYFGDFRT